MDVLSLINERKIKMTFSGWFHGKIVGWSVKILNKNRSCDFQIFLFNTVITSKILRSNFSINQLRSLISYLTVTFFFLVKIGSNHRTSVSVIICRSTIIYIKNLNRNLLTCHFIRQGTSTRRQRKMLLAATCHCPV